MPLVQVDLRVQWAERQGKSYVKCWWYFMRNAVRVSWMIPGRDGKCPWFKFTGQQPDGRAERVPGCLGYYKVVRPESKMHARARRCLCFGRAEDQPVYR